MGSSRRPRRLSFSNQLSPNRAMATPIAREVVLAGVLVALIIKVSLVQRRNLMKKARNLIGAVAIAIALAFMVGPAPLVAAQVELAVAVDIWKCELNLSPSLRREAKNNYHGSRARSNSAPGAGARH